MTDRINDEDRSQRRDFLRFGGFGLAGAAIVAASAEKVAAQAPRESLLRTVLNRGRLIVGTGSTNPPWHFEDERGQLTGMDIVVAKMLAKGLFDDESKIEFVRQDPAQRIPNINAGRVDCVIQFMTVTPVRAQLVNFSRPYVSEGVALLTSPRGRLRTYAELLAAGNQVRASVLQNATADDLVKDALPQARVMQLDTEANVIQALDSTRVDVAVVDMSTVRWMTRRNPNRYLDAGHSYRSRFYAVAIRQNDYDWLNWINTTLNVSMFAQFTQLYDNAMREYFGLEPRARPPGFPVI